MLFAMGARLLFCSYQVQLSPGEQELFQRKTHITRVLISSTKNISSVSIIYVKWPKLHQIPIKINTTLKRDFIMGTTFFQAHFKTV